MAVGKTKPLAIIDIGSNSVRLVVYAGAQRIPAPIFNEKVLAGLGRSVGDTGAIAAENWDRALAALRRFKLLLKHMGVTQVRTLATAAVRDAANGAEFCAEIERIGLDCRVITAEEEAWLAGEGVLSAMPGADGIVGDLGGGSLELVPVRAGSAGRGTSLPLGVLRAGTGAAAEKRAAEMLRAALTDSGLAQRGAGRPFYMVGGSWRALARADMIATGFPLPVVQGYRMAPARAAELRRLAASKDPRTVKAIAPARLATTPVAAMLLSLLVDQLQPSDLVVSSFGIREGLLYSTLKGAARRRDPLIEGARDAGGADRRFGEHGDILDRWIAPLFDDEPAARRIRLAACLLADVAWQASPDFRADRGVEMALHGNWVGVTAPERVLIAQALSSSFGRDRLPDASLAQLCTPAELHRAEQWGAAIRLAQRLSGGVGSVLQDTRLEVADGAVVLAVPKKQAALASEPVLKRLERVAAALGCAAEVRAG
ncbi:MAG: Exopolyphosphatase [uncultured Sphingomonas sp.]|uniref:Exopolyphosphatase n=1 Tax=uncultured Sphingomonas sp. TaxID=158754 RepID=A0A6J4S823_9SPHN|nr:MAG: Exopolyphosphatase [uncultured Sphingomonas sp.]